MRYMISVFIVALIASGAKAEVLWQLASPNEEFDGYFGMSVSALGDVDGDGCADAVVGAIWEDGAGIVGSGRVYVFSGATGDTLYSLVSPNAELNGIFGFPVSRVGDISGDGIDDVAVGAWAEDGGGTDAGRVYVFSGQTGGKLHAFVSPNPEFEGNFSIGLSGAGDVNNDGVADIIIGAHLENPGSSPSSAGRAYVFSGATGDSSTSSFPPMRKQAGVSGLPFQVGLTSMATDTMTLSLGPTGKILERVQQVPVGRMYSAACICRRAYPATTWCYNGARGHL